MRRLSRARRARPSTFHPPPSNRTIVQLSRRQPARVSARQKPARSAGFTLVEMLVVIVIIAILVGIGLGIYQQARNTAWKEKTRDTARQIATAWNVYLMDNHAFPAALVGSQFPTTAANMSLLYSNTANHIYLEQSADQRKNGMKDKWGNYFQVQFQDATYSGTVPSPIDGSTINANVIVWSFGPHPSDKSSSYCVAWQ